MKKIVLATTLALFSLSSNAAWRTAPNGSVGTQFHTNNGDRAIFQVAQTSQGHIVSVGIFTKQPCKPESNVKLESVTWLDHSIPTYIGCRETGVGKAVFLFPKVPSDNEEIYARLVSNAQQHTPLRLNDGVVSTEGFLSLK
ncbi:hypothetical protein [Vibrio rarus]|uniref:hypothetical protein n=1 Tax=Vibrio rarus TaxID=413403 RepID=UPI0021C47002|nr:hypothetical protein [Vibrio rarus]